MKSVRAEMGLGALLIFLAIILVAAIAAGVLITITGEYQGEVLETGEQAHDNVASYITTVEVFAEDGSDGDLDHLFQTIKLHPGSEPLDFRDTLVVMSLFNVSTSYNFNSSIDCGNTTSYQSNSGFGIKYQFEGDKYRYNYLNNGDVAQICYASNRSFGGGEELIITALPPIGSQSVIKTFVPDVIAMKRTMLYPKADSFT